MTHWIARRTNCLAVNATRLSRLFVLVGVILLLFCSPRPAQAGLRIADGAAHAALWRKVYDLLPDVWQTRRIILVQELTPRQMERLVADTQSEVDARADDSEVDGCYQTGGEDMDDDATISVIETLRGEEAELVFAHEYGHFVWDQLLSREQRDRYRRIWRSQKRAGRLVSDYSNDSEEEGFAESFAHFLIKPSVLDKRDSKSAAFLQDLIDEMRVES